MNDLERYTHKYLKEINPVVLTGDPKIVKKYGKQAYGIDHLIQIPESKKYIAIQDKWELSVPSIRDIRDIRHFISAVEYLKRE